MFFSFVFVLTKSVYSSNYDLLFDLLGVVVRSCEDLLAVSGVEPDVDVYGGNMYSTIRFLF